MNPTRDSFQRENNSGNLIILVVILILILGIVFTVIFIFKPKTKDFVTARDEIKNTPKEHIESIDARKTIFMSITITYPIAKKDAQIVSGFGMRDHPVLDEPRMHIGIDNINLADPLWLSGKVAGI